MISCASVLNVDTATQWFLSTCKICKAPVGKGFIPCKTVGNNKTVNTWMLLFDESLSYKYMLSI